MPTSRYGHSCGLVTIAAGPEVIVAGGLTDGVPGSTYSDSVEIYSVDADSWREGNKMKAFFLKIMQQSICLNCSKPLAASYLRGEYS